LLNFVGEIEGLLLDALKAIEKRLIESVVFRLVAHANRPRHYVEAAQRRLVESHDQRPRQGLPLVGRDFDAIATQVIEKIYKHGNIQADPRRPIRAVSCSVLISVPRNGMPPPTRDRSTPEALSAQIQSMSSLVDGFLRRLGRSRTSKNTSRALSIILS